VITFDPDRLAARRTELEEAMGAPGFWDDQASAARISTEHSRLVRKLERYERLQGEFADADELLGLGEDEAEIGLLVAALEDELARLEEDALFTGEYDAGDAVLEIHAGTGGTDAQDWADMLLRMYLRWASDRGFATEVLEASPGEEAGLKSTTVAVKGENAASTGSCACHRSTPRTAGTRRSPRSSSRRFFPTTHRSRSTSPTCASTRIARAAQVGST
jgi:peptide chain release factor 2